MATIQKRMETKLKQLGIPYKDISVYGSQIVITTSSRSAADRWAKAISPRVARLRGLLESTDIAKVNKGTVLKPTRIKVWRIYFTI